MSNAPSWHTVLTAAVSAAVLFWWIGFFCGVKWLDWLDHATGVLPPREKKP